MNIRSGTVHLVVDVEPDGREACRRLIVVDTDTGKREQIWPEAARPVLSVPIAVEAP